MDSLTSITDIYILYSLFLIPSTRGASLQDICHLDSDLYTKICTDCPISCCGCHCNVGDQDIGNDKFDYNTMNQKFGSTPSPDFYLSVFNAVFDAASAEWELEAVENSLITIAGSILGLFDGSSSYFEQMLDLENEILSLEKEILNTVTVQLAQLELQTIMSAAQGCQAQIQNFYQELNLYTSSAAQGENETQAIKTWNTAVLSPSNEGVAYCLNELHNILAGTPGPGSAITTYEQTCEAKINAGEISAHDCINGMINFWAYWSTIQMQGLTSLLNAYNSQTGQNRSNEIKYYTQFVQNNFIKQGELLLDSYWKIGYVCTQLWISISTPCKCQPYAYLNQDFYYVLFKYRANETIYSQVAPALMRQISQQTGYAWYLQTILYDPYNNSHPTYGHFISATFTGNSNAAQFKSTITDLKRAEWIENTVAGGYLGYYYGYASTPSFSNWTGEIKIENPQPTPQNNCDQYNIWKISDYDTNYKFMSGAYAFRDVTNHNQIYPC